MKYAIVETSTNIIKNIIELESNADYTPIEGFLAFPIADETIVEMGGTYDDVGDVWSPKPPMSVEDQDAEHEEMTEQFMNNDKVSAMMIFDILKILNANTLDMGTDFAGVIDLASYRAHVKQRIIDANS